MVFTASVKSASDPSEVDPPILVESCDEECAKQGKKKEKKKEKEKGIHYSLKFD
jgi:hypothetical protein